MIYPIQTLRLLYSYERQKREGLNSTIPKLELATIPGIPALKAAAQEMRRRVRQIDSFALGGREVNEWERDGVSRHLKNAFS